MKKSTKKFLLTPFILADIFLCGIFKKEVSIDTIDKFYDDLVDGKYTLVKR